MGRAFQYAGARGVVMSLWSIPEGPTVRFVEHLFTALHDGLEPLAAVQAARAELRRAGYEHPFYWAPFIFVGEG